MSTVALAGCLLATAFAPGAHAKVEGFQALTPSSVDLTAVAADPTTGLIYAQENGGTSYFVYDPRTNAWSDRAPSPINADNNAGAAYLGGRIYVAYTHDPTNLAVYDIASSSWTTMKNPLGLETGTIAASGGKLYLAVGQSFVAHDLATGITTPLAEPPKFESAECFGFGFQEWGGLQVSDGKIYGHQGNSCTGFAVYDIASNSWLELPLVPAVQEEGPGLGSAINPVTNTYLAYGPYPGSTLWRYDIEAGSWSTVTLPFEVEDGGMAYISLPGYEGVYMVQGEEGGGFTRYTERNQADLSSSMSAAVAKGGQFTYSVQVFNNGPERASGVVLSDQLPAGTTLVSAVPSQGTCAATATFTCNLGLLRTGTSASLTINVKTRLKNVTNAVAVASQALDGNPGNDSATVVSKQCVVPKLRNRRLKGAKKALRGSNCKPGKVSRRFSGKVKAGKVIRSRKARGALLPAGRKIKLVVSRGPKDQMTNQGQQKSKAPR